jgi:rubrerythrin
MSAIAAENAITVQNLLAAFEGESNAHAKYTAFAAKPKLKSTRLK